MRANAVERIDPTHTTMIRRGYERELGARLRKLRGAIIEKLIGQDAMGLRVNYAFALDAAKVDGFMDWLRQEQGKTLEVYTGAPSSASDTHWSALYIDKAYKTGVGQSANALRKGGATVEQRWTDDAFNRPIHADRVGILHTRNYKGLEGITSKIETSISRTLAEGMINGSGAKDIARKINAQVVRYTGEAKRLARTEIINAHAESTLNSFEEAGIQGVEVMSNCRCAWKPVVVNGTGIQLR
jgi:hypothetical protein